MNQSENVVSTALSNNHTAYIKMVERLIRGLKAKLYANRGYISQDLKLITYHRKNMQVICLSKADT